MLTIMRLFSLVLFMGFLGACQNQTSPQEENPTVSDQPEENTEEAPVVNTPQELAATLEALGGLEAWAKFRTLEYDLKGGFLGDDHQVIDLQDRRLMVKADSFNIGFDGQQVWVTPNKEAVPDVPARFYSSLYFYFFSVPFVLSDPGVNLEKMENQDLGGETYEVVRATFGEGVGDSPQDEFRILINPDTKKPAYMLYTVSYFDQKANEKFSAIHFEEMQEVEGLTLPKIFTWYEYKEGKLGEKQSSVTFENVSLMAGPMGDEMYAMPEGADVDEI